MAEETYGAFIPQLKLGPRGLSDCSFPSTYAQVAVSKYTKNPNSNSDELKTSVLKFNTVNTKSCASSSSQTDSGSTVSASVMDSQAHFIMDRELALTSRKSVIRDFTPAFYVTLGFASQQDFNFTEDIQSPGFQAKSNFTVPTCSLYDSVNKLNIPCGTCNISSYNNFNVTFGCKDISVICAVAGGSSRRLFSDVEESYFKTITSRNLATDDCTTDDGQGSSAEGKISGAQFGALLKVKLSWHIDDIFLIYFIYF